MKTPDGKDIRVLSKSPEEIKKGLKRCAAECYGDCPYAHSFECIEDLTADALAYIEQLEARLHGLYLEQQEAATLKADYDVLFKRFRHLIQSDFIASFDQLDPKTHTYKRDIAEADVHLLRRKNMKTIKSESLGELFDLLRKAKIARCNADNKKGVTREELENLDRKIKIYDYLIDLVIKEI